MAKLICLIAVSFLVHAVSLHHPEHGQELSSEEDGESDILTSTSGDPDTEEEDISYESSSDGFDQVPRAQLTPTDARRTVIAEHVMEEGGISNESSCDGLDQVPRARLPPTWATRTVTDLVKEEEEISYESSCDGLDQACAQLPTPTWTRRTVIDHVMEDGGISNESSCDGLDQVPRTQLLSTWATRTVIAEHVMEEGGISNESSCDGLDQVPCATRSVIELPNTTSELTNEEGLSLASSNDGDLEHVQARLPPANTRISLAEVTGGRRMRSKALSPLSIRSALMERCKCGKRCMEQLTFNILKGLRKEFWSQPKPQRMKILRNHITSSHQTGHYRFIPVQRWHFCSQAFRSAMRVNKNTFSRALDMDRRDAASTSGKKPRNSATKTLDLINWLEQYATYHGDRMPDTQTVVLPYKTIINDVYRKFLQESVNPVSRAQFFNTWRRYFPHLKIKKTNSFSKCTACTNLERQLQKATCHDKRSRIKKLREEHYQRQMLERKLYYGKREESRREPHGYLSMIIDGMDQSKTNLPHFKGRLPKNLKEQDLLKTHLTGVISHGHGGFHTFIDLNEYPHDPNLTINVLLKMLKKTADLQENSLPRVFYIQADNCGRENKNRFVLAFCELLVRERIFGEVHLSFLPVGHTHEDVDAAFSKVADQLRKRDVETVEDLLNMLPKSEMLGTMFDVRNWLEPEISTLMGVSSPLHYKFESVNDEVSVCYKGQSQHAWINLGQTVLRKCPAGKPAILKEDFSKMDVKAQLKQIRLLKHLFMKEEPLAVWEAFYEQIESEKTLNPAPWRWPLESLPRQQAVSASTVTVSDEILQITEKDRLIPQVTVRRKRNHSQKKTNAAKKKTTSRTTTNTGKPRRPTKRKGVKTIRGNKRSSAVEITYNNDEKKHIWILIFWDLFSCFVTLVWQYLILLTYLRLVCLLRLLQYLNNVFMQLVDSHIGFTCRPNIEGCTLACNSFKGRPFIVCC